MLILCVCENPKSDRKQGHNAGNTQKSFPSPKTFINSRFVHTKRKCSVGRLVFSSVISGIISYVLPIILSLAAAADVSVLYGNTTRAPRFANSLAVSNPMLL